MDRQRARPCPPGGDPGGRRLPAALLLAALVVVALVTAAAPSAAAPASAAGSGSASLSTPPLELLSQTRVGDPGPGVRPPAPAVLGAADGLARTGGVRLPVPVDASRGSTSRCPPTALGTRSRRPPRRSRSASLPTLPGGGVDLRMPVVVGSGTSPAATPQTAFTIHLLAAGEQCGSFPSGVFPVRVELVDTSGSTVVGSFVTHLVTTEAAAADPAPPGRRGAPGPAHPRGGPLALAGRTPGPAVGRTGHPDTGRRRRRDRHGGDDRRPSTRPCR